MKNSGSLKNTLTRNFILVAVLPILAVGLIAFKSLNYTVEREITAKNVLLANSLASELARFLNEALGSLELVEDMAENGDIVSRDKLNDYLASLNVNYEFFDMIKILDAGGVVTHLAPYDENLLGLNMSYQEYYQETRKGEGPYWSRTFISPRTGQPTLTLSLPLEGGVVVGYLKLSDLRRISGKIKLGEHGYAGITDNDGTVIAHRDETFVSERLNVRHLPPVRQGMAGNEGTFRYTFMGVKKIGSVAIVPHTGWVITVAQPIDEAFAHVKQVRNIILAGCFAAMILAVITAFHSLRKALKPLMQLTVDSRRIADGDYFYEPRAGSYLEINNLASGFRHMTEAVKIREKALQNAHDSLERKVEERTAELTRAKEAAVASDRAKSAFLANMSHELRTPLNAILGFSQLMARDPGVPAGQRENLGIINRSGEHLLGLINDVLDMSKIETGRITLTPTDFDLRVTIKNIEEMMRERAEEKGLRFSVIRHPDTPRYIRTDEGKLRQVLINLLGNAIKFTEMGCVTLGVGAGRNNTLVFQIEDTGVGIAPGETDALFDAFVRTDSGGMDAEGAGLGLAISRRFATLMGGDIRVESEIGKGSLFTFTIRPEPAETTESRDDEPLRGVVGLEPGERTYRILIAEDNPGSRRLLAQLLQSVGFDVHEAVNGREAVEMCEKERPDLIFMDMRMPVMDGFEATRKIKATPVGKQTPIIALTASVFDEDKSAVLAAGCDDFVPKPAREADIFDVMKRHLGVRYIHEEPAGGEMDRNVPVDLTPADMEDLPAEWIAEFSRIVPRGDEKPILELIDRIRPGRPELAEALVKLVQDFRFDKLLALTDKPVENGESS